VTKLNDRNNVLIIIYGAKEPATIYSRGLVQARFKLLGCLLLHRVAVESHESSLTPVLSILEESEFI
jgi:hypothetical protein